MIADIPTTLHFLFSEIRNQTDIAVVGLSGGADSSLTAILCAKALKKNRVYGVSMPFNDIDIRTFNARSTRLAEALGIHHRVRSVSEIANAINERIYLDSIDQLTDTNAGNSRSRARMCILYGIAHSLSHLFPEKKIRVIGTGNLSEDFIGYDTKGGDALADIFPIGELFKSEVYQLLEHFRDEGTITEDLIDRTPSAGLEEGQTDERDLGYTYDQMETGIRFCLRHYNSIPEVELDEIASFVWNRHMTHKHKHEAPPVIKLRQFCD